MERIVVRSRCPRRTPDDRFQWSPERLWQCVVAALSLGDQRSDYP
jgi:hypothetical protein